MLRAISSFTLVMLVVFVTCVGCSESDKPNNVSRIVIHCVEWDMDTRVALSCQDVADQGDSVVVLDQTEVADIVSVVEGLQLREMPGYDGVDARICAIFYDSLGVPSKTISIEYSRHMEIDGHVYEPDETLLELIISFLPRDYLET